MYEIYVQNSYSGYFDPVIRLLIHIPIFWLSTPTYTFLHSGPIHVHTFLYSGIPHLHTHSYSHLNCFILAWGYRCERITKSQKCIVKLLSLSKYNAHTELIFKTLKLLKVIDILDLQELKFYYK